MKLIYMEEYNPTSLYLWGGNRMVTVVLLKDNEVPKVMCLWSACNKIESHSLVACFIRGFFKPEKINEDKYYSANYGNISKDVADDSGFARLLEKIIVCKILKLNWDQK